MSSTDDYGLHEVISARKAVESTMHDVIGKLRGEKTYNEMLLEQGKGLVLPTNLEYIARLERDLRGLDLAAKIIYTMQLEMIRDSQEK